MALVDDLRGDQGVPGGKLQDRARHRGQLRAVLRGRRAQGQRGGETCKVLSYLPHRMLSFSWNAPPDFGHLRGKHTWVVVEFEELDGGKVKVRLTHLGWGQGDDWNKLYDYFGKAWGGFLSALETRFAGG